MSFDATDTSVHGPTIVVGLGNPILGDDGVGWRVVDALEERLAIDTLLRDAIGAIETDRLAVGGLSLMERLVGYERALIVDADLTGALAAIRVAPLEEFEGRPAAHLDSAHDVSVGRAIEVARDLGSRVPRHIMVVTIGIPSAAIFGDSLSPAVAAAVGPAVDAIIDQLAATAVR